MHSVFLDLSMVGVYIQTLISISQVFFYVGVLITGFAGCIRNVKAKYLVQGFFGYFLALLAPPFLLCLFVMFFKGSLSAKT